MVAVHEQQHTVYIEHHNGRGFIDVLHVVLHPFRVQMGTASFERIRSEPVNWEIHNRHEVSLTLVPCVVHPLQQCECSRTLEVARTVALIRGGTETNRRGSKANTV